MRALFLCYSVTMKNLKPFTDDTLEWDGSKYLLTKSFIKANYEVTYSNDQVLDRRRKKNSTLVYNVLISRLCQSNVEIAKWLLNNTDCGRAFLKDILSEQMEADLANGYNDLGQTSAVNVANGQVMDRRDLEKNLLCVNAELMIDNVTNYFPFNLFMQYQYPWTILGAVYGFKR